MNGAQIEGEWSTNRGYKGHLLEHLDQYVTKHYQDPRLHGTEGGKEGGLVAMPQWGLQCVLQRGGVSA